MIELNKIEMYPIGIIHSPYKSQSDVPIQSVFREKVDASIEVYKKFEKGLKDLEDFSHAFILTHLHKSNKEPMISRPYLEDIDHGVFSIRTPHRPNHIGLTIIKIDSIVDNIIHIKGVDMIDDTPVLDIKPYISYFDCRENTRSGWVEKHFKNGNIPKRAIKK